MGEHKFNPVAQAAARGEQQVRVLNIGEGYALLGVGIHPMLHVDDGTGEKSLVLALVATGGKPSQLAPMQPVNLPLGEIARLPLADVYKGIEDTLTKTREGSGQ